MKKVKINLSMTKTLQFENQKRMTLKIYLITAKEFFITFHNSHLKSRNLIFKNLLKL